MILESHFRLMLSVLPCFSLAAVHLTGAAPMTKPSITAEQYPRCPFQRPRIFFPASGSHTSITILHVQPNDAEVDKAMPKRFYTHHITLLLCIHVDPSGILCYGTTLVILFVHLVRRSVAKQNWRIFFPLVSLSKKKCRNFNIHLDVLFQINIHEEQD